MRVVLCFAGPLWFSDDLLSGVRFSSADLELLALESSGWA